VKRFVLAMMVLGACGKGGGGSSDKAADLPPIDVAAINKLVPDAWKSKIEFTVQTVGERHEIFEVAAPKGWKKGFVPGTLEPDETAGSAFGFGTRMDVSSNCDGDCVPKDWAATAEKVEFKQFMPGGQSSAKVVKDEKGAGRRTMIAASDDKTYLVMAWWKDGDKSYSACRVSLGNDAAKDLMPAFTAACASARQK
jgi:hypothetical protein